MLNQMFVFFLIMMVGFVCRKVGWLNDEASKKISGLVVNIANPACLLASVINMKEQVPKMDLLVMSGLAVGLYVVLLLMAIVLPKILRVQGDDAGVYRVMLVFSNVGFMGYPLLASVYGSQAVLFAVPFNIIYNILIYTYGVKMLDTKNAGQKLRLKEILNVGVISCFVAIFLFLVQIPMPIWIEDTVGKLGGLTAPLSMLVIGDSMANMKLRELFTDVRLMIFSVIKLVALPILLLAVVKPMGLSEMNLGVFLVMVATPVGSMTAMLAQQYDGDYELASRGVSLSTILSVATLPLVSMIMGI